jgi:branched-chain amino acid transport system ATP-binding protein
VDRTVTRALEARGLSLRADGVPVLESIDLEVGEWEIVAVVGPNGAGKTTLLDVVTGVERPQRGTVLFRGADVTAFPAHERVSLGMARTWRGRTGIPALSLMENLHLAQHAHVRYGAVSGMVGAPGTFLEERELSRNAEEILDFLGLWELRGIAAGALPSEVRWRGDLAMALATDPTFLVMDEPSAGLDTREARELAETLSFLRSDLNLTILLAEHHLPLALETCDFVYAMSAGRLAARGRPAEIRRDPDLAAAYLGERPGRTDATA